MIAVIVCIILLLFFSPLIITYILDRRREKNPAKDEFQDSSYPNSRYCPKIGAAVSESFYEEVQSYCRRNHITVSELIRKSVKSYMESNM